MSEVHRVLGMLMSDLGRSAGEASPAVHGQAS